jgi:hypothetical protein
MQRVFVPNEYATISYATISVGLVGLLNPPTRKSRFRPIRGHFRVCRIPNCFLAWSELLCPGETKVEAQIKLFGVRDFSETFPCPFPKSQGPGSRPQNTIGSRVLAMGQ